MRMSVEFLHAGVWLRIHLGGSWFRLVFSIKKQAAMPGLSPATALGRSRQRWANGDAPLPPTEFPHIERARLQESMSLWDRYPLG